MTVDRRGYIEAVVEDVVFKDDEERGDEAEGDGDASGAETAR